MLVICSCLPVAEKEVSTASRQILQNSTEKGENKSNMKAEQAIDCTWVMLILKKEKVCHCGPSLVLFIRFRDLQVRD